MRTLVAWLLLATFAAACAQSTVRGIARPVVRGVVLDCAGQPTANARVVVSVATAGGVAPAPVTTAADGTFALEVEPRHAYDLCVEVGGGFTMWRRVLVGARNPSVIELWERGAWLLRGRVIDADGSPVAEAGVQAWREPATDATGEDGDQHMQPAVRTDSDGGFTIEVARRGNYELIAHRDGLPLSRAVRCAVPEPAAAATSVLQFPRWATVTGRVLGPDGAPLVGAGVRADADGDEPSGERPDAWQRFGGAPGVETDGEGRFALRVHPDTTHTIVVEPRGAGHWSLAKRGGVAPGTADLEVSCTEDELAGSHVRVVVTCSDGGEVEPSWLHFWEVPVVIDLHAPPLIPPFVDGAFELPRLKWNERYRLEVWVPESIGLASAGTEFVADRREMTVALRLEPYARVAVRVVDSSGAPARDVAVSLFDHGPRWTFGAKLDDDGRCSFDDATPGSATVLVFDGWREVARRVVTIVSGVNPEIVVGLSAR